LTLFANENLRTNISVDKLPPFLANFSENVHRKFVEIVQMRNLTGVERMKRINALIDGEDQSIKVRRIGFEKDFKNNRD
jgi:hypothetical protein